MRVFSLVLAGLGVLPAFATPPYAYVTNATFRYNLFGLLPPSPDPTKPGTVAVINWTNRTLVKTVAVGKAPLALAAHPNGSVVYVANYGDNTVSIISTATNQIAGTITLPAVSAGQASGPTAMAILPDGKFLYVAVSTIPSSQAAIDVISTQTNKIITTIQMGTPLIGSLLANPDGNWIYSLQQTIDDSIPYQPYNANIGQIDTTANALVNGINVPQLGVNLAITPDGAWLYFPTVYNDFDFDYWAFTLYEISTNPFQLHHSDQGIPFAGGSTVGQNGKQLYVLGTLALTSSLAVLDIATKQELWQVGLASGGGALAETPDGKALLVVGTNEVSFVSTATSYTEAGHLEINGLTPYDAIAVLPGTPASSEVAQ